MRKAVFLVVCAMLLLGSAAMAQVFPTLAYEGFDANTWTYTYRIDCAADSTFPFGQLIVQAEVPNFGLYFPWTLGADTLPATGWTRSTQVRQWLPVRKDNAIWRANTTDDVIPSGTVWTGRFTLIVPNSAPTGGLVVTMDGGPVSTNVNTSYVPGPAPIPEPSSLLALGGLVGGLIPLIRRRK